MKENSLYAKYSINSLLDNLNRIYLYDYGDNKIYYNEITDKQNQLLELMGVPRLDPQNPQAPLCPLRNR
jgi:hypothetical protein